MSAIDRTGVRVGMLVVTKLSHRTDKDSFWVCRCDCGRRKVASWSNLARGVPVSCGCRHGKTTHGQACRGQKTAIYNLWKGMLQRCRDPKHKQYKDYGGRGITVCKKWHDFAAFYADMGDRPPGRTLDRKNNDGSYCKRNCRWATREEQAANRREYSRVPQRDSLGKFKRGPSIPFGHMVRVAT